MARGTWPYHAAMLLYVTMLGSSGVYTIENIGVHTTIGELKCAAGRLLGVRPCQISLVGFAGIHLTDPQRTLGDYGIVRDPSYLSLTVTIFVP